MLPSGTPAIATERSSAVSSHNTQERRGEFRSHQEPSPSNKHEKQGGRGSPAMQQGFPSNEKQAIAQDRVDVAHGKVTDIALNADLGHKGHAPGAISPGRTCFVFDSTFVGPPSLAGPLAPDVLQRIHSKTRTCGGGMHLPLPHSWIERKRPVEGSPAEPTPQWSRDLVDP